MAYIHRALLPRRAFPSCPAVQLTTYIRVMSPKQLSVPTAVGKAFIRDMLAFSTPKGQLEGGDIVATAACRLNEHMPMSARVRLPDLKEQFHKMKDHA